MESFWNGIRLVWDFPVYGIFILLSQLFWLPRRVVVWGYSVFFVFLSGVFLTASPLLILPQEAICWVAVIMLALVFLAQHDAIYLEWLALMSIAPLFMAPALATLARPSFFDHDTTLRVFFLAGVFFVTLAIYLLSECLRGLLARASVDQDNPTPDSLTLKVRKTVFILFALLGGVKLFLLVLWPLSQYLGG